MLYNMFTLEISVQNDKNKYTHKYINNPISLCKFIC